MKNTVSNLIFGNGKYIEKKSVFWNMTLSILSAIQSAIMLMLVTRLCGTEIGGIFSISYTTSQLMYYIGSYSCRVFHSTDTCYTYSYRDYSHARLVTCAMMIVVSIMFCLLKQYSMHKVAITLAACGYKLVEAIEDLDHGELQRVGRLDIAGRIGTFRIFLTDIVFFIILLTTRNIIASFICITVAALTILIITHRSYKPLFFKAEKTQRQVYVIQLLSDCFPLFMASFFEVYINNASKYAIDKYLDNEMQTYFSVIFMPVFIIHLLSAVCFRPQLKRMSEVWNTRNFKEFNKLIVRQIITIAILSFGMIIFGALVGLRLLGLIYNLTLHSFTFEFSILLLGGGFVALYSYMYNCITIMRKQRTLLVLFGIIFVVALVISNDLVSHAGLMGACYSYLLLMFLEASGGVVLFFKFYYQALKEQKD